MERYCNRYRGRYHKEGRQYALYLEDNLVAISPIDRADVTPHTMALVKVFKQYIACKLIVPKFRMAEARCVSGVTPEYKQFYNFPL
jgi:hypothetical protein